VLIHLAETAAGLLDARARTDLNRWPAGDPHSSSGGGGAA